MHIQQEESKGKVKFIWEMTSRTFKACFFGLNYETSFASLLI